MPIRVVSFDMEGTLIDHSYSKQIWEGDIPALYAEAHGIPLEDARRRVLSEYAEVGEGQPEWYDVGYWWKRLGLPHYWRDLPRRRKGECNVYPDNVCYLSIKQMSRETKRELWNPPRSSCG